MIPSRAVEMVDELLQDLCNDSRSFGGKFVILGGDFRQVLPVIKYAPPSQIVKSTLKSTTIWSKCTQSKLSKYMRKSDVEHANVQEIMEVIRHHS